MGSPNPSGELLFLQRVQEFRHGLSTKDRADFREFHTVKEMIADIEVRIDIGKSNKTFTTLHLISGFAKRWEPYFDIVGIFVSTKPDILAPFWGAFNLMFKLSLNYRSLFERLTAKFDEISMIIRVDVGYVKVLRGIQGYLHADYSPLIKALASVYDVAISFCQEVCNIFSKNPTGVRKRIEFHVKNAWIPFETRFGDLMERLQSHQVELERQIGLLSTTVLAENCTTLNNIKKQLENMSENHKEAERLAKSSSPKLTALETFHAILLWIQSPTYTRVYERAKMELQPETLGWFLENAVFKAWLSRPLSNESGLITSFNDRVLGVFGAPGYGKTMLSAKVIEHLQHRVNSSPPLDSSTIAVCFYHFDKLSYATNEPSHLLRALLAQALSYLQTDRNTLDAASLMIRQGRSGELFGSEAEVECLLLFALSQLTECVFLVDGLDECTDPNSCLNMLFRICENTSTKLLIISRPSLTIPKHYDGSTYVKLHRSANLEDIRLFIRPQVQSLHDSGLLPSTITVEEMVDSIVSRSNSVFLWAKLMIAYLSSPVITRRARMEAMTNMVSLDGLDAMYNKIISTIDSRMQVEREFMAKIFQWLVVATRPLTVDELQAASSIRLFEPTSPELDYLQNFDSTLIQVSGALIDIHNDTVQFVHLSVAEYLTRRRKDNDCSLPRKFQICSEQAHLSLAAHSLSYLVYDLPSSPLSGSANTVPVKDVVHRAHPFLQYSSTNWNLHAKKGLQLFKRIGDDIYEIEFRYFVRLLSVFITGESTLRVWIEACWLVAFPPETRELVQALSSVQAIPRPVDFHESLFSLISALETLAKGLETINDQWADLLRYEPNEIWDSNIETFVSTALFKTQESRLVTWFSGSNSLVNSPSEATSSWITLLSAIGLEGQQVATLSILPSACFDSSGRGFYAAARAGLFHKSTTVIERFIDCFSHGWQVKYQLQQIHPVQKTIEDKFWLIPQPEVKFALCDSIYDGRAGDLRVNASLSADLTLFSLFSMVFRSLVPEGTCTDFAVPYQRLEPEITDNSKCNGFNKIDHRYFVQKNMWQKTFFSPRGDYFATVCEDEVRFYSDSNFGKSLSPDFKRQSIAKIHKSSSCIFHNHLPIACVDRYLVYFQPKTYNGKQYGDDPRNSDHKSAFGYAEVKLVYESSPASELSFSKCGQKVLGTYQAEGRPKLAEANVYDFFDLKGTVQPQLTTITQELDEVDELWLQLSSHGGSTEVNPSPWNGIRGLLRLGQVYTHTLENGEVHATVLKYHEEQSVLVYEDINSLGEVQFYKVLRLPKFFRENKYYASLLTPSSKDENLRIFFLKAVESVYDFRQDRRDPSLISTMIIEKQKSRIPRFNGLQALPWERKKGANDEPPTKHSSMLVEYKDEISESQNGEASILSLEAFEDNGLDDFRRTFLSSNRKALTVSKYLSRWSGIRYSSHPDLWTRYHKIETNYVERAHVELVSLMPKVEWCSWLCYLSARRNKALIRWGVEFDATESPPGHIAGQPVRRIVFVHISEGDDAAGFRSTATPKLYDQLPSAATWLQY